MREADWDETIVLDDTHLGTFTGGDPDFEKQILEIFLDNAPSYLTALKDVNQADWKSTAHKLKGAARSIGAWRLAKEAERAEHMGAPSLSDVRRRAVILELEDRLHGLVDHIKARS